MSAPDVARAPGEAPDRTGAAQARPAGGASRGAAAGAWLPGPHRIGRRATAPRITVRYAVLFALRDRDSGGPLARADYRLRDGTGAIVATGTTPTPHAIVEHPAPGPATYTLEVIGVRCPAFPAHPPGAVLAEEQVETVALPAQGDGPTEVAVSLGMRPRFTFANHGGAPASKRRIYLVPQAGDILEATTDEEGYADLRLREGAPPFDVFSSKRRISRDDLGEDIARIAEDHITKALDGHARDVRAAETIELQMLHRSRMERALFPHLSRIVPIVAGRDASGRLMTIDAATCNFCAGIALAILRGLGYEQARLNDTSIHVTVRVQPPGEDELIIDASMPQFFARGTAIDRELKRRGGWMGTEAELQALIEEHVLAAHCHQAPTTPWPMQRASVLLENKLNAERWLEEHAAGAPAATVAKVRAHLQALRGVLREALFFESRFDDPQDDVFGYVTGQEGNLQKRRWAQRRRDAATGDPRSAPQSADTPIADLDADNLQLWRSQAIDEMLGLFRHSTTMGLNAEAALALADGFKAWDDGDAPEKPHYPPIRRAIASER